MTPTGCPYALNKLGDHLKKRRHDLRLQMKEAAELLGCHATSVANWESGRRQPGIRPLAKLIQFLGYDPRPEVDTVAQGLVRRRTAMGLSQKTAAECIGVDPSTLAKWEMGCRQPTGKYREKVYAFLGHDPRPGPVTVGERLKRRREQLALTLRTAARRLGVVQATLCRWESGEREPQGAHLERGEESLRECEAH